MNGIYYKLQLMVLSGALVCSTLLGANESRDGAEVLSQLNGRLATSKAERLELKTLRLEEEKAAFEQGADLDQDIDAEQACRRGQEIVVREAPSGAESADEAGILTGDMATVTYTTTHEGALHSVNSLSLFGEYVTLNNGLTWYVRASDRHKTANFTLVAEFDYFLNSYIYYYTDTIIVLPCTDIFSSFDYVLVNCTTGDRMNVDLVEPVPGQLISTYFVTGIINNTVILNDNSAWKIDSWDHYRLKRWALGDSIEIGINSGWFSGGHDNILINVQLNEHVRGSCLN